MEKPKPEKPEWTIASTKGRTGKIFKQKLTEKISNNYSKESVSEDKMDRFDWKDQVEEAIDRQKGPIKKTRDSAEKKSGLSVGTGIKSNEVKLGSGVGALNDLGERKDQLGRQEYITSFAELICSGRTKPPIVVGIFGQWGSGKSTFLQLLEDEINRRSNKIKNTNNCKVYPIEFNAWKYSSNEVLWPGIVREIVKLYDDKIFKGFIKKLNRFWLYHKTKISLKKVIYIITFLLVIGMAIYLIINSDVICKIISSVISGGMIISILPKIKDIVQPMNLLKWFSKIINKNRYGEEISLMKEIGQNLRFLDDYSKKNNIRILILIDDLDRCEPEKAVEMLQAINLLLNFKSFIVCIGIDIEVICNAIGEFYKKSGNEKFLFGFKYLDKIIQIPFSLPNPTQNEIQNYIKSIMIMEKPLTEETETIAIDDTEQKEENYEPFSEYELKLLDELGAFIRPNPRHVKKIINIYRLIRNLAALRHEQFLINSPKYIASWVILSSQWPYTMRKILDLHSKLSSPQSLKKDKQENVQINILNYYKKVEKELDTDKLNLFDYNLDVFKDLIKNEFKVLKINEFEILQKYSLHFNYLPLFMS